VIAMKKLKCAACSESSYMRPRPTATFHEPSSRLPWEILGIDCKEVTDHEHKEKTNYLVIIDEVSKLTRFVELYTVDPKQSRNATEAEVLHAYEVGWSEIFGDPRVIRHDEEGALKGTRFLE